MHHKNNAFSPLESLIFPWYTNEFLPLEKPPAADTHCIFFA